MATTAAPTYADLKAQQIDREIAAHQAEIKRLKGKRAQYAQLAKKAPATPPAADAAAPKDQKPQS